jgi:hypothetical protein
MLLEPGFLLKSLSGQCMTPNWKECAPEAVGWEGIGTLTWLPAENQEEGL